MIVVLTILFCLDLVMIAWLARLISLRKKEIEPKPGLKDLPIFTAGPQCASCGKGEGTFPVEVTAKIPLLNHQQLPVTIKICQGCVSHA